MADTIEVVIVQIENMDEIIEAKEFNKRVSDVYLMKEIPEPEYAFDKGVFKAKNLREDISLVYMTYKGFICIEKRNGVSHILQYSDKVWEALLHLIG